LWDNTRPLVGQSEYARLFWLWPLGGHQARPMVAFKAASQPLAGARDRPAGAAGQVLLSGSTIQVIDQNCRKRRAAGPRAPPGLGQHPGAAHWHQRRRLHDPHPKAHWARTPAAGAGFHSGWQPAELAPRRDSAMDSESNTSSARVHRAPRPVIAKIAVDQIAP
jgi:hypothetical protein